MKKVIAYYRVSTKKQEYMSQKFKVHQFCKNRHIEIVNEAGEYRSGMKNMNGLVLPSLIEECLSKKINLVVCSPERLTRKCSYAIEIRNSFIQAGLKIYFAEKDPDGSLFKDEKLYNTVFATAELESIAISEKTKRGLEFVKRAPNHREWTATNRQKARLFIENEAINYQKCILAVFGALLPIERCREHVIEELTCQANELNSGKTTDIYEGHVKGYSWLKIATILATSKNQEPLHNIEEMLAMKNEYVFSATHVQGTL